MFDSALVNPFLNGVWVTLQVTAYSALLGTSLAVLSGLAALSPFGPVRWANRAYVEVFRGTSAIVQLYWIFFALPLFGPSLSPMAAGVITLGLNMGAYGSEVVRGAVQAVPRGQTEASIALNLTPFDRMRYVIFPQAVVAMLPPYGNLLIELLKASALVSLITLSDIIFEAQKLRNSGAASTAVLFSIALFLYFGLAQVIAAAIRVAEQLLARGLEVGRGASRRST